MKFPIDFEQKAKLPPQPNGAGYPYRLSAKDLMENFKYAALEIPVGQEGPLRLVITEENGTRRMQLLILAPSNGTHVLGVVDGEMEWIATEEC